MIVELERDQLLGRANSIKTYLSTVLTTTPVLTNKDTSISISPMPLENLNTLLNFNDLETKKMNGELQVINAQLYDGKDKISKLTSSIATLENTGVYNIPYDTFCNKDNYMSDKLLCGNTEIISGNSDIYAGNTYRYFESSISVINVKVDIYNPSSVTSQKPFIITMTYMIHNAYWQPSYDLYITNSQEDKEVNIITNQNDIYYNLQFDMYSSITQNTKEEWDQIILYLSTTTPYDSNNISPSPISYQPNIFYITNTPPIMYGAQAMGGSQGEEYDRGEMMRSNMLRKSPSRNRVKSTVAMASIPMEMAGDVMLESAPVATGEISGDLGTSYLFRLTHPVSIKSQGMESSVVKSNSVSTGPSKLFISSIVMNSLIYSYMIPSQKHIAYMKSYGKYTGTSTSNNIKSDSNTIGVEDISLNAPLLQSFNTRLYIQGVYTGVVTLPETQVGSSIKLELKEDKHITIKVTDTLEFSNANSNKHIILDSNKKDKNWMFTMMGISKTGDKVKYNVKEFEYYYTITSTHTKKHLIIISESLPYSSEEGITIELISPSKLMIDSTSHSSTSGKNDASSSITESTVLSISDIIYFNKDGTSVSSSSSNYNEKKSNENNDITTNSGTEQDLLELVLQHDTIRKASQKSLSSGSNKPTVYMWNNNNNHIIWTQWIIPGIYLNIKYCYYN